MKSVSLCWDKVLPYQCQHSQEGFLVIMPLHRWAGTTFPLKKDSPISSLLACSVQNVPLKSCLPQPLKLCFESGIVAVSRKSLLLCCYALSVPSEMYKHCMRNRNVVKSCLDAVKSARRAYDHDAMLLSRCEREQLIRWAVGCCISTSFFSLVLRWPTQRLHGVPGQHSPKDKMKYLLVML